ncbi:MAG TPA: hypothetical protein VGJ20_31500 [Xanthobacteraceae bacterium]|jgi:hypothetical protein
MGSSGTYLLRHQDRSSLAIFVRHLYGGTLVTVAGTDPRVAGLLYIAALPPDANETSKNQQAQFPVIDIFSLDVADGRVWLKPKAVACFAGDLPEQEQKLVWGNERRSGGGPVAQISFLARMREFFQITL